MMRSFLLAVSLLPIVAAGPVAARSWVWDLSPLFADRAAWEVERIDLLSAIDSVGGLRGSLGVSPEALADGLDAISRLRTRGARMALYGILRDEVEPPSEAALLYDAGTAIEARVESAIAWAWPEILAIGPGRLRDWIAREPRLSRHRVRLLRLLSEAAHVRDADTQAALAAAARWPLVAADVWQQLVGGDLGWPRLETPAEGTLVADRGAFLSSRGARDRWTRTAVPRAHLRRLGELDDLFALLLTRRMDADLALARQRRFTSGIDAIWFLRDAMPAGTARRMAEFSLAHLEPLQRYVGLRARALGLGPARYEDLTAPPGTAATPLALDTALARARAALSSLGDEYLERLDRRLTQPWFHFAATPGKGRTYGIFPPVGGAPPYFVQTFDGSHDGARRLAGGLALQMAFADWPAERPLDGRDDSATLANGLIYFGDVLADDAAIAAAAPGRERVEALVEALDLLARHFYRWSLVTALDLEIEDRLAAGDPPSGAEISASYLRLLRAAWAGPHHAAEVDDAWGMEWATFSVPFLSYEHEFWPAAMAAGCSLVEALERGDASARRLVAGGAWGRSDSDRSFPLLREAGVDFAGDEPYHAVLRRMHRLLDALERELDDRRDGDDSAP